MSEDFGGMTEDEWFNSDYMDEEDYRSVHGASNVGDFSWSGQDMWNTAPDYAGQVESNYMHGLLGGGFNAYSTPNTQSNDNTKDGLLGQVKGNFFDDEKAFILGQRKNILNDVPTLDHVVPDVRRDLTKFKNDVRPNINRRPSLAENLEKTYNKTIGPLITGQHGALPTIANIGEDIVKAVPGAFARGAGGLVKFGKTLGNVASGTEFFDENDPEFHQPQMDYKYPAFGKGAEVLGSYLGGATGGVKIAQNLPYMAKYGSALLGGTATTDPTEGNLSTFVQGTDYANPVTGLFDSKVSPDASSLDKLGAYARTFAEEGLLGGPVDLGINLYTNPALRQATADAAVDLFHPDRLGAAVDKSIFPSPIPNMKKEIIAHHGGNLPNDKFDISKTGSGQGMSTYGWGINLTGSPKTADAYKTMATMRGGKGSVYDVDVDDLTFINREKTLSEQTQDIQDIAKEINSNVDLNTVTGQTLYSELTKIHGSKQAASEFLNSMGVKGISLPDGYMGDGRNYVVFDDSIITVLRKDGELVKHAQDVGGKITTMPGIAEFHNVDVDVLKSKLAAHRVSQKDYTSWTLPEQKSFIDNAPDTIKGKGKDSQLWGREGQMLTERQIRGGATQDLAKSLKISDSHLKNLANKRLGITIEEFKTLSFDDQKLAVQIGEGYDRPIGVGHNLSIESFLKQYESGLPQPSHWLANANNIPTNFGEMTLVGDKGLIDNARTTIGSSDMYSGRQPGSRLAYKDLDELAKQVDEKTLNYYGFHTVDDLTPGRLEGRIEATKEYVETINPKTNRYYNPDDYKSYSEMRRAATLNRQYIDEPFVAKEDYLGEVHHTIMNAKGQEVPWNVEDVMKAMRKKKAHLAGTEGLTGAGQARALASDKFKNISEVKKNRDRLTTQKGQEAEFKHIWKSRHEDAMEDVGKIAENIGEKYEFGHLDRYGDIIEDSIKGADLSWTGWPAEKLAEVKTITNELKAVAKNLETEYFEAKSRGVVDISEFKGAIIPEGATEVEAMLIEKGVTKILKYGTEKERASLFKQFPEHFFAAAPIGLMAEFNEDSPLLLGEGVNNVGNSLIDAMERIDESNITERDAEVDIENMTAEELKAYIEGMYSKGILNSY